MVGGTESRARAVTIHLRLELSGFRGLEVKVKERKFSGIQKKHADSALWLPTPTYIHIESEEMQKLAAIIIRGVLPVLCVVQSLGMGASSSSKSLGRGYYQLVIDSNGETSMVQREFTKVESVGYSNVPQLCRSLDSAVGKPKGITFTEMNGENPWHHCPGPQIVVCVEGAWYIKTTDGKKTELPQGAILFQDNTADHPTAEEGTQKAQHFSGAVTKTCTQVIIQLEQPDGPILDSLSAQPPL